MKKLNLAPSPKIKDMVIFCFISLFFLDRMQRERKL